MDSKQLVNDIVNKRLSKAKKTINEELSNHVLKHIERKKSDVINEAISFEPGVAKAAAAGVAAAGLAGAGIAKGVKALHKRFGAVGRLKAKTDREGKKTEKAEAKKELAWLKGPKKKIDKLNAKKHKPGRGVDLTDKEKKDNQKIDDQIEDLTDKFNNDWAKSHKKDVKKGRIEGGPGNVKKAKKAARAERDKLEKFDKEVGKLRDKLIEPPEGGSLSKKDKEHNKQINRDIEDVVNKANVELGKLDKKGLKSVETARRKEDEGLTDEEKEAERVEKEKEALDTEITTRTGEIEKTQAKMNIDAILGKDASEDDNQNLASQQRDLDKLVGARAELDPPEEESEEEDEE